jgi:hypothetical protein
MFAVGSTTSIVFARSEARRARLNSRLGFRPEEGFSPAVSATTLVDLSDIGQRRLDPLEPFSDQSA